MPQHEKQITQFRADEGRKRATERTENRASSISEIQTNI